MLKFRKDPALTADNLNRLAVKRIMIVITAGVLLLLFDFFIGFDFASLSLLRGDNGVYLVRPGEGRSAGHIRLKADIETDDGTVTKKYDVSLYPYARKGGSAYGNSGGLFGGSEGGSNGASSDDAGAMSEDELLAYEMRSVIGSLNDDQSAKRVSLPDQLRTGEKITWTSEKKTNTAVIAFGMMLLAVLIYVRRLDPLEKIRLQQQDSVRRQLPEFINRLVLLLGAGLVLSSAFEKIVEENLSSNGFQSDGRRDDYFYHCMGDIYARIKETNGSLAKEFRAFARSGLGLGEGDRELMRISNIISDNISKGVELADKLQSESEMLWLSRKRSSEERGRLAETKLTLPLTVFLLVLVVVTVSPALLEL
ncbi:MAG: type II secretion system F family protein [Firmicutes bacterium]|nr:type II secretion system F family protein [Bacillota bacterium]